MRGVALGACGAGAGDGDEVAGAGRQARLADGVLVDQAVAVAAFGAAGAVVEHGSVGDLLAEVGQDRGVPLLPHGPAQALRPPAPGAGVGEVEAEHLLVVRHGHGAAGGVADQEAEVVQPGGQRRAASDVRVDPQAGAHAALPQRGGPALGEPAAVGPAAPGGVVQDGLLQPLVDVDDVDGAVGRAEFVDGADDLLRREVGGTAHPDPERPLGQGARAAGEGQVAAQDAGGVAVDQEQVERSAADLQARGLGVGGAQVGLDGAAGVREQAPAGVGP